MSVTQNPQPFFHFHLLLANLSFFFYRLDRIDLIGPFMRLSQPDMIYFDIMMSRSLIKRLLI